MDTQEIAATLSSIDLFEGLSSRVLKKIVESGHVADYAPGTPVVSQGESVEGFKAFSSTGVEMHVVLSGSALVQVQGAVVATLEPGTYFGELSLIDGGPRSADVVAHAEGLQTLALPKWTFDNLLDKHPEVAVPMLRVVCGRLRRAEAARDG